jgi:type I restriction enzyme S subunit
MSTDNLFNDSQINCHIFRISIHNLERTNHDAWEQRKLFELYDFSKGKGLSLDSFYEGKNSLSIAYGHLYTKYSEVINEVTLSSYDENGVLSQRGDILFPGSSTVPLGTAQSNAIMIDNVKLGGDVIIARAKNSTIYAPFISYQINAQRSKLFPITVGTTITHMYGKDIANIEYKFPKYDEQVRIGKTLESIDSLITLHQRK